jgi:sarcosine oxidase, subunit beta
MATAEVVVVGAGVIGTSVAYHLARGGCREVVVLDRGATPGAGSTGRATGGFRAQFGSEINVRLSLLSRQKLRCFADETGVDPGYEPVGYLFLCLQAEALAQLRTAQALQHTLGLTESRMVGPAEARALNPAVAAETLGGAFCPSDGYIRPLALLRGYREAAQRLGVRFEQGVECTGFRLRGARIEAVRTQRGEISAGSVVNAAGAWAAKVAALAGVELPVQPLRRQVAITRPCALLPADMPMTIFCDDGFHLRVRDGRVLLLRPDVPDTRDPFDDRVDDVWVDDVARRARQRLPCLRQAGIDRAACWAGLYEMSPDHHALLGAAPGVENLHLANGSSGHGVMHAPALGQLLAEMMLEGAARALDVHALRPTRFEEGEPVLGSALL